MSNKPKSLQLSLPAETLAKHSFSDAEKVIIQLIFLHKAKFRVASEMSTLLIKHEVALDVQASESNGLRNTQQEISIVERRCVMKLAELLGISPQKFHGLEDFVYQNETNI